MTIVACPPNVSPSRGVVNFVPADFKAGFPEFTSIADAVLSVNFGLATLQLNNSCNSRVLNALQREQLLNLLTAHVTQLRNGINGQAASGIVGRISEAAEGSVRASADMGNVTLNAAYFLQTQWGAMYWQATAQYRTAVYVPAPAVCADFAAAGPGGFSGYVGPGCGC